MPVEKDGYREKSLEGFDCWIRERRFSCLIPRLIPPIDHPFIPLLNQKGDLFYCFAYSRQYRSRRCEPDVFSRSL